MMNVSNQSKKLPELAPQKVLSRGTPRMLGLPKNSLSEWQPCAVLEKPVIRLTDFQNRCFSGIEQARWKSKKPMLFVYSV